jgi:hypothetical protein
LQNSPSYDDIHAQVEFKNRVITTDTTVQGALSSMLGLIIPASGCPHTIHFRPMSRFHQPFADTEEILSPIFYLAGDAFTTGSTLICDGGLTIA